MEHSRDGGGPTLLGGVKEVGGVGHPRASTLTPRVSESSVCPPGSLRSHIRQSAEPFRSLSLSTNEGCPARPSGCLAFLRVTVDFLKIRRSAWRAQETEWRRRQAVEFGRGVASRRASDGRTAKTAACSPLRLYAAGWPILCRSVLCAILASWRIERGSSRLMTPGLGCHAFFMVASGRSGRPPRGREWCARQSWYIFRIIPATLASPIFSPPPPAVQTYVPSTRAVRLHTFTMHIHGHGVQREPAQLRRHSPPVFALAWHGTASLFGHFRPGQAPPTFILITSWFAPGFCSPSFFPSERFPTADAWEPHLCPLAYSCPGPCDAGLDVSLSLYFPGPLRLVDDLAEIRRRCALDVTVQGWWRYSCSCSQTILRWLLRRITKTYSSINLYMANGGNNVLQKIMWTN